MRLTSTAFALLMSATRVAGEVSTVVYPTGQFPADVLSVQAAIDAMNQGGSVLLKATNALGSANDLASESFVGNNIARFVGSFADVFFDEPTHDSVLVGFSGNVVDLGTNNHITGFTRMAAAPHVPQQRGRALAVDHRAIHEALEQTRDSVVER